MKPLNTLLVNQVLHCVMVILIISHVNSSILENGAIVGEFIDCLSQHNFSNLITRAIYTPQDASFVTTLNAYVRNLRFNTSSTPKPLAIVTALEVSHVQTTILCAKARGLEMRIRSGGHDYEGLSYVSPNPFIVLDLFNLRSIDIDLTNDTAWVQSGATIGELYYNIAKLSNTRAFPASVCHTVGVGGHFSGGGYGYMVRKFGLTVDNVIDAEIVDASGTIHNRKTMGEELFWAIRGGGAASFCVVIAWKISLVHVPEIVTTFQVTKALEEGASDIFYQWQHVAPNLDPNLFIRVEAHVHSHESNKGKKTVKLTFIALYLGRSSDLVQLLDKSFPFLGLTKNQCNEPSWVESTLYFDGLPMNSSLEVLLNRVPLILSYAKHKSDYVKEPIHKVDLQKIWKKMIEVENTSMQFSPYGGRMSEIPESASPFPHRKGNLFKIQYNSFWMDNSKKYSHLTIKGIDAIHNLMTPYVSKNPREAFFIYRDIDVGTNVNKNTTFAFDYFKGNLRRLLMVKAKVDPDNFFRNEQSIPVLA